MNMYLEDKTNGGIYLNLRRDCLSNVANGGPNILREPISHQYPEEATL